MSRWALFREIWAAFNDPERIGDLAAYKGELGRARARPEVERQLDGVRDYRPSTDFPGLEQLPDGTFGREYARFLKVHALRPITFSDRVDPALLARNALTVRYAAIHDMVHVLTGFDATWPGEVGVWAFVGGQFYSWGYRIAAVTALLVAPLMSPLRLRTSWRNFRRGWAMGRRARILLAERLESSFERDLRDVRSELGITEAEDLHRPPALDGVSSTASA